VRERGRRDPGSPPPHQGEASDEDRRRYVTAVLAELSVSLGTAALALPADAVSNSAQSQPKVGDTPAEFGMTPEIVSSTAVTRT
jgi:hypothetical protein